MVTNTRDIVDLINPSSGSRSLDDAASLIAELPLTHETEELYGQLGNAFVDTYASVVGFSNAGKTRGLAYIATKEAPFTFPGHYDGKALECAARSNGSGAAIQERVLSLRKEFLGNLVDIAANYMTSDDFRGFASVRGDELFQKMLAWDTQRVELGAQHDARIPQIASSLAAWYGRIARAEAPAHYWDDAGRPFRITPETAAEKEAQYLRFG